MTVGQVCNLPFVSNESLIYIRDEEFTLRACAFRHYPAIRRCWALDVKAFSWDDDGLVYITVRGRI
ncbi:hypothetical protein [Enterocloster clostridioformis]|uniref:Uncharacterized protein n=1 Tax=Enterocloster clostridioformis TaxID=1531 RepID=A0A2X2UP50_9FIRM|nr:hypothetical protein [Enterocloster clostridioformis]MCA5576439.1 hypothetical protein [Enterocloster clostridioformis]SQB14733.1 Uncharacterised protein [Enterocloster clostridioformis]